MSAKPKFVDTNVLIYLFDADAPAKQTRARELLREEKERLVVSVQVLGEFYVTVTRKLAEPLTPEAAAQAVDELCRFQVRTIHPGLVRAAVRRSQFSPTSYWDALIVETALDAGADVLFTEDLQDGQDIDGLRIANPFRGAETRP